MRALCGGSVRSAGGTQPKPIARALRRMARTFVPRTIPMSRSEDNRLDALRESRDDDGIACVREGLYAYLKEIHGYRAVCLRHEGSAAVEQCDGELQVT